MKISFRLTGVSALLMKQDDVQASDLLTAWRKDPINKKISVPGDDRSPPWTWTTCVYHDGKHLTIPAVNLMTGLRKAGAQIILKRQTTFKELTQSGMFIDQEFLRFGVGPKAQQVAMAPIANAAAGDMTFAEHCKFAETLGFRLFVKRATVGTAKHVRVRPRFDTWTIEGSLTVVAQEITREVVGQLLTIAGRGGLCDWRPACKTPGPFGMFRAEIL